MKTDTIKPKSLPFPWHGWLGITVLISAEALLHIGNEFVATWMTPIMWTGYILTVDAFVYKLQGKSWMKTRLREMPFLILVSVGVWLLFEVYNFHLKNWHYVGLPADLFIRDIGFFWSFATIMPGVFETADLLNALLAKSSHEEVDQPTPNPISVTDWIWIFLGILIIIIPLVLRDELAAYLFAFIWIGFIPILDPVNKWMGAVSLQVCWRNQKQQIVIILLSAGFICGFLWETWNYQAFLARGAYWVYTVPQPLRIFNWHFGKMPVLGLLGFPPFALELFAFYQLLRKVSGGNKTFGSPGGMIT